MIKYDSNFDPIESTGQPFKLLISEIEAARILGISPRTLWTLRTEGKIPFIRIGRSIRYSVEALRKWIEDQGLDSVPPNLPR